MTPASLPKHQRTLCDVLAAIKTDGRISTIDRMRHSWLRHKLHLAMSLGYLERKQDLISDACLYRLTAAGESRLKQHERATQ